MGLSKWYTELPDDDKAAGSFGGAVANGLGLWNWLPEVGILKELYHIAMYYCSFISFEQLHVCHEGTEKPEFMSVATKSVLESVVNSPLPKYKTLVKDLETRKYTENKPISSYFPVRYL